MGHLCTQKKTSSVKKKKQSVPLHHRQKYIITTDETMEDKEGSVHLFYKSTFFSVVFIIFCEWVSDAMNGKMFALVEEKKILWTIEFFFYR